MDKTNLDKTTFARDPRPERAHHTWALIHTAHTILLDHLPPATPQGERPFRGRNAAWTPSGLLEMPHMRSGSATGDGCGSASRMTLVWPRADPVSVLRSLLYRWCVRMIFG
jgi:hypothetical protein